MLADYWRLLVLLWIPPILLATSLDIKMDGELEAEPAIESTVLLEDEALSYIPDNPEVNQPSPKTFLPETNPEDQEETMQSEFRETTSANNVTFSPQNNKDDEDLPQIRQQLELMLSSAEVDDSLSADVHKKLQVRYKQVESTLEAFICYIDSVNLEMKACCRLCQQLNGLISSEKTLAMDEDLLGMTKKIRGEIDGGFVEKAKNKFNSLLSDKNQIKGHVEEYKERKEDFKVATHNFRLLLNTANLNVRQLGRLEGQYDKILGNYQHSKCMMNQHVPNIITHRMNTLLTCFCDFSEDLEKRANERNNMSQLFQHFETALKVGEDLKPKGDADADDDEDKGANVSNCTM